MYIRVDVSEDRKERLDKLKQTTGYNQKDLVGEMIDYCGDDFVDHLFKKKIEQAKSEGTDVDVPIPDNAEEEEPEIDEPEEFEFEDEPTRHPEEPDF